MSWPWETHLLPAERPFARQLAHWAEEAGRRWRPVLTDFYDLRRQWIARVVVASVSEIELKSWGGYPDAERVRLWIGPEGWEPGESDWQLGFVKVEVPGAEWTHGDVLGSILGLGVRREKIGDISVVPGAAWCVTDREIASFLCVHWQRVGRYSVHPRVVSPGEFVPPRQSWRQERVTVASLRLDAVLHEALHWSRAKAAEWIKKGMVQVNWAVCQDGARPLAEGDVISVRGVGRLKILALEGESRRGRQIVRVGHLE
ncbi:RNA-binding protein [Kyrpidia spormannii]|uniref:RNA-binding protein n=1 Tax=Kyrpidia spormannii TaxID=2055160 RepID=A0A2K8N814_9BACL|nr:YlmH/Sll1252 family protein [Kyrpidia spormannii]ATY84740.1 RNA-binding protein [Kyrpidia spormannii]